jgi:hypothetical protein
MDVSLVGSVDTDPTHYTYKWTEDGAGSLSNLNIKNPVYTAGVADAGGTINFKVVVTNITTGCKDSSNCTVNVSAVGSCPQVPTESVCNGSTNTYTADVAPTANETWVWSANNGATINPPNGMQSVSVTAGGSSFTLTLTKTFANPDLDPLVCTYEVSVHPCLFCSYTQGFWGNKNGLALLPSVLTTDLIIGRTGHSIIIPAGSSTTLNSMMPGGQTPTGPLKNQDCSILSGCINSYLTKQNRFNNVLISQTITLALNVRVHNPGSGDLAALELGGGCIITSVDTIEINQNVLNYLGAGATVGDLLDLANDVLGGVKTPGVGGVPSYGEINDAVDAINNGFDECRLFLSYCPDEAPTTKVSVSPSMEAQTSNKLAVAAFPNPFNDKVRFEIKSTVSGPATLEVYNMFGQKVKTVFKGNVFAGKGERVEFNVPPIQRTNLFYVLRVGANQVAGKLISAKQ